MDIPFESLPIAGGSSESGTRRPPQADELATWGQGRISDAAWALDGSAIIVADTISISSYRADLTRRRTITTAADIDQVFPSANEILILVTERSIIRQNLFDNSTATAVAEFGVQPVSIVLSPLGDLAAIDTGTAISLCEMPSGRWIADLAGYTAGGRGSLAFTSDCQLLAVVSEGVIQIWDLERCEIVRTIGESHTPIRAVAFGPDAQTLLSVGAGRLCRWRVADGALLETLADIEGAQLVAAAADGCIAAAAPGKLYLWPAMMPQHLCLDAPCGTPLRLAFDPSGQSLLLASSGGVQLYSSADGVPGAALDDHWESVSDVAFSPDGNHIASVAGAGRICSLDTEHIEHRFPYTRGAAISAAVAFDPTGQLLALGSEHELQVCRTSDGALIYTLPTGPAQSGGLSFTCDGTKLIVVTEESVQIRSAQTGLLLDSLDSRDADEVAIAADRSSLALVRGSAITIWDLDHMVCRTTLTNPARISEIALADCGRLLAISTDTQIQLLRPDTGEVIHTLPGCAGRIALHPKGHVLAAVSERAIILYQVADGKKLAITGEHADTVTSLAFAAGKSYLTSASRDGTVRLWRYRDA